MRTLLCASRSGVRVHRRTVLIEAVEPRLLFATIMWGNPNGGDWDTPGNWVGGKVPTANDDVIINLPSQMLITHKENLADSAKSITSNQPMIITMGSLDLNGGTISMSSKFELHGGTILNATLATEMGGSYVLQQTTAFNNVTLDKTTKFTIPSGQTLNVFNMLRFNDGSKLTITSGGMLNGQDSPQGGAVLAGTGTINLGGQINGEGNAHPFIIGANITIATQTGVSGKPSITAVGSGGVNSQATIDVGFLADVVCGGTFGTFTNEGTININHGGHCTLNGFWSNIGTLHNENGRGDLGELELGGIFSNPGTVKSPSGGTVRVTGTCNLDGKTLNLDSTTGTWTLDGGKIDGGTINSTGGASIIIAPFKTGEMDDLNLDDLHLDVPKGADLSIQGSLNLGGGTTFNVAASATGNGGRIDFNGNATLPPSLGGTGTINFTGGTATNHGGILNNADNNQPLTITPGITIKGGNSTIESAVGTPGGTLGGTAGGIINGGKILPDVRGQTMHLSGGPFVNDGTIFLSTGATLSGSGLATPLQNAPGGSLGGTGAYVGDVNDSGTISPGAPNATGSMHITGNLDMTSSATLIENLGGTASRRFSSLIITGSDALAGFLQVRTYDNFKPADQQTFSNIVTYSSESGSALPVEGLASGLEGTFVVGSRGGSLKITAVSHLATGSSLQPPSPPGHSSRSR